MMVLRPQGLIPERRRQAELDEAERHRGRRLRRGAAHERRPEATAPSRSRLRRRRRRCSRRVDLTKIFGGLTAVDDVSFAVPEQVDRLDHRAQRRRQDDVLQHAHRALQADARRRHLRRQEHDRRSGPTRSRALGVARTFQNIRLFGTMTAVENVLVGQHARLKAGVCRLDPAHPAGAPRGEGGAREGARAARLRRRREAALHDQTRRATSPTATSAGSRSPARSPPTRSCCCSTSRPRA